MKKLISFVLAGMLLLSAFGCSNSNQSKSSSSSKASSSVTKKQAKPIKFTTVGALQYTITSIQSDKITNKKSNWTNAEYNFPGIKNYPKNYYRTTLDYTLANTSDKTVDLSFYQANVLLDGLEYTHESNTANLFDENSNGVIQPGTKTSGKFELITKQKIKVTPKNIKINIGDQYAKGGQGDPVGTAGVAQPE